MALIPPPLDSNPWRASWASRTRLCTGHCLHSKKQRSFTGTIASYLSYGISGPKRWEFTTPDLPVLFCRGTFRTGSSLSLEWSAASLEDFFPAMKTPFICVLCRTDCANPLSNHCLYDGEISITRLYSPICLKLVCNTSPAEVCHV